MTWCFYKPGYALGYDVNISYNVTKPCASSRSVTSHFVRIKWHWRGLQHLQLSLKWIITELYISLIWYHKYFIWKIGINGRVKVPTSESEIFSQVVQNIISLLPNATPAMDQVLLLLTMHIKKAPMTS